ncbi:DUF1015 domain-containing protein [Bacteroidia bacterium]|nr:DUF1015 domain-containing protein [Bacteroidia bacterium]
MPKIYPFKALRPTADKIGKVTAKSTDYTKKEDLIAEIRSNPISFHHVTKSHLSFSGAYQEPEKFLPFAAQFIVKLKEDGVLLKEEEDSIYVYEQKRLDGRVFKGLIALCSIDDYRQNKIKKHEEIRPSRLKFLVELFKTTKVMGEPTLLAYSGTVNFEKYNSTELYSFESVDGKKHSIYRISYKSDIKDLQKQMEKIENFYIADGHHRSASTEVFNDSVDSLTNDSSMCCILHEDQMEILPFHRIIKPVITLRKDDLINQLSRKFKIRRSSNAVYEVTEARNFGMYIQNEWYILQYKNDSDLLDIELLEEEIIRGIFNINDSRTDSQITFHAHTSGLDVLKGLVDSEAYSVAITTKPCDFSEVRKVADANNTLPPKSTYIEPKLRSGIIIQEFEVKS